MDIKFLISTLIGIALAAASVQAFADSGWYYDEDSDTIVLSYSGSPVTRSTSLSEAESVEHIGAWHYDEGSDSIVINGDGSRSQYTRTTPSIEESWIDFDLVFLDQ